MTDTDPESPGTTGTAGTPEPNLLHRLPRFALVVILGVVVACLAACIYYLLGDDSRTDPPRYYIALGLLFFALSTAGNLIFANTKAFLQLKTGLLVASMAGPAVLWFVALVVFSQFVVKGDFFEREVQKIELTDLEAKFEEYEKELGWYTFEPWRALNKGFDRNFESEDGLFGSPIARSLRKLALRAVPTESGRLTQAQVRTLWVYSREHGVLKLQRIEGQNVDGNGSSTVKIPFRATPSDISDGAQPETVAVLFQGHHDAAGALRYRRARDEAGGYVDVTDEHVDCLIVTWYQDYLSEDYLFVDTRAYAEGTSNRNWIGVLCRDGAVGDAKLWTGRVANVAGPPSPPVSFSKIRANPQRSVEELASWFGDWSGLLQRETLAPEGGASAAVSIGFLFDKMEAFGDLSGGLPTFLQGESLWFDVDDAEYILTLLVRMGA